MSGGDTAPTEAVTNLVAFSSPILVNPQSQYFAYRIWFLAISVPMTCYPGVHVLGEEGGRKDGSRGCDPLTSEGTSLFLFALIPS